MSSSPSSPLDSSSRVVSSRTETQQHLDLSASALSSELRPDTRISVRQTFGINLDLNLPAFSQPSAFTPVIDPHYIFDSQTTTAIILGLAYNKRVLIHGLHGTGKSTHIEQVAARLNWSVLRINLDSHLTRSDLLGQYQVQVINGQPETHFKDGSLPWACARPILLLLDEYDACRPELLFLFQNLLESGGKLHLLEASRVIKPHPWFRLMATANTLGQGDQWGLYSGTQILNQGQMDRWGIISELHYPPEQAEKSLLLSKLPRLNEHPDIVQQMITLTQLLRQAFQNHSLSLPLSSRTLLNWGELFVVLNDCKQAFIFAFYNRCSLQDKELIHELYQRVFNENLQPSSSLSALGALL